ncbi:Mu transposase-like protein [Amycolatopsis sulphurea]|uniref:Mu transposase-like protein n=1 Tax=Amycolatopsis sulphurea TaxID=76022 RepID=A0A2A9F942_9PSEU|nr:transposase [Amycolatopsis sulphurea]PFG47030.1 Mu transposase-like protein [Amycolatopsis sulphurea]
MSTRAGMLDLSPGAGVVLDAVEWTVQSCAPQWGQVLLCRPDGAQLSTTVRALVNHPCCRSAVDRAAPPATGGGRQPAVLDDLTPHQRELVRMRFAHLQEVETGFRGGDPLRASPGEPRPAYDPQSTTLTQRRLAKVAELTALGRDQARLLGFEHISERTLKRLAANCRAFGMLGCVKGNWLRRGGTRPSITEQVREAIFAVHAESLHRSRLSMKTKERLIHQYVRERFGPEVAVPCYQTLRSTWIEWFGPGGARQRYLRSAAAVRPNGQHVVVHRPGQVVAMDTTVMPVKVRETVFGDPVSAHLSMALDLYTHSIVAFRLTLVSDTSVDVAMMIRDVMMPLPLRADWGEDMEWPYPGVPAAVVAEFAGHRVAALPFFTPETVTIDHGSVYKNHHLVEVQRLIGANILPSRVLRPTDKHAVERAFAGIQSLLFEFLLGYQGVDVADRGVDPEGDAVLTMAEMEHLIAAWCVKVWQNRKLGECAPAWDPGGSHSPNSLFAAAMEQGGFQLEVPSPALYYQLLPTAHVKIDERRGVKVRGLWYDGPALGPYRNEASRRGGRHKGKWVIRYDKRDPREVFFQDPHTLEWHTLRWEGLPPQGEVPSFGEARRHELLRAVAEAGLAPKSDTELLPVLLELAGGRIPVDQWPTQMSKQQRTQHARDVTQAAAAAADRPPTDTSTTDSPPAVAGEPEDTVVPLGWCLRARQTEQAIDAERRRRREDAVGEVPQPPPRLGEGLRRRSLLVLVDDTDDTGGENEGHTPVPEERGTQ